MALARFFEVYVCATICLNTLFFIIAADILWYKRGQEWKKFVEDKLINNFSTQFLSRESSKYYSKEWWRL